jgi:hypothetical protein
MNTERQLDEKWNWLGTDYPEIAEMLLWKAGLANPVWKDSDLSGNQEQILEFLRDEFEEGTGDELFEQFQNQKSGALEEGSELLDRDRFFDCLDTCAAAGFVPRIPTGDGGFYYGTTLQCLLYLEERGETGDVEVEQLYWFEEETGVPVQNLVAKVLENPRSSLVLPGTEKDQGTNGA